VQREGLRLSPVGDNRKCIREVDDRNVVYLRAWRRQRLLFPGLVRSRQDVCQRSELLCTLQSGMLAMIYDCL